MDRMKLRNILVQHAAAHPALQPQDVIKLCYQATFGAEHLLTDEAQARAYFEREWEATAPADKPLWEDISDRYVRVDLAAWKAAELSADSLFRMFFLTASAHSGESAEDLHKRLTLVTDMVTEGTLPFSPAEWVRVREAYERDGGGAVHHSEAYRAAEHPAYRVVERRYLSRGEG